MKIRQLCATVILAAALGVFTGGCSTAYYSAMETLGKEKRHLLKDNVADVRQSQDKATEEFKDALTRVKELTGFSGGDLEAKYNRLKASYEDCEDRAGQIETRISKVETVADDLFAEWKEEITQINDRKLKSASQDSLAQAKQKYRTLSSAMTRSTKGMYPVLGKLKDYVLYLKHNLNARAVGALGNEVVSIEQDVTALVADMNRSIKEAEHFIQTF